MKEMVENDKHVASSEISSSSDTSSESTSSYMEGKKIDRELFDPKNDLSSIGSQVTDSAGNTSSDYSSEEA